MTDKEKRIIEKQIEKADKAISVATGEVDTISDLLHKFGYLYNAQEASGEIIFVPCDENFVTLDDFDEKLYLDKLVKGVEV